MITIRHIEPEMESGYRPGEFGWMAPGPTCYMSHNRMVCKILHLSTLAVYPVEKEGGTRRNVPVSPKGAIPLFSFGSKMHTGVPHSISVRLQKCSDGSRRGPLMDSIKVSRGRPLSKFLAPTPLVLFVNYRVPHHSFT